MMPAPISLGLTLCELIIIEQGTKKLSLINTFTKLQAPSFPFDADDFWIFAVLTGTQGAGDVMLVITHAESNTEIYSLLEPMHFPDRLEEVRVYFELTNITFPLAGVYLFTLYVDSDWVAHRRLEIQ